MSDYQRQFHSKEEAQHEAAKMYEAGYHNVVVMSSWQLNGGPLIEGEEERWLISVGEGGWLLNSGSVGLKPSN